MDVFLSSPDSLDTSICRDMYIDRCKLSWGRPNWTEEEEEEEEEEAEEEEKLQADACSIGGFP